jgi:hypothetical protein
LFESKLLAFSAETAFKMFVESFKTQKQKEKSKREDPVQLLRII